MARTVAIGKQNFESVRKGNYFYIDKTSFIKEWWDRGDDTTLITRPRRFGKTLNMSMIEQFFSVDYTGRSDLFEDLFIWQHEQYRQIQGTYPVISLSFANIKEGDYQNTRNKICQLIINLYVKFSFIRDSDVITEKDKQYFDRMSKNMDDSDATLALYQLSSFLYRYYGKKVIIILDEYDTPMQEAYVHGFWDELAGFFRSMFNATFKTNPCMERAIMTGITRISKESVFSDLNHLQIVTTTSDLYAESFGFTENEVFDALEEYDLSKEKDNVKRWYDGFSFGDKNDIYNPWSIINFLSKQKFEPYWANSSSNSLVDKLIQSGNPDIKQSFEELLVGKTIDTMIDEQIVYNQLNGNTQAIWSLLLASGYLKVKRFYVNEPDADTWEQRYELAITNFEVKQMFERLVKGWFDLVQSSYNAFINALLTDDLDEMNDYMNHIALETFSYFDIGGGHTEKEQPERFYHGFVLGLMVELKGKYIIKSNRESGYGRYDIMLEPKNENSPAIILEFKVYHPKREKNLEETLENALAQIRKKEYAASLQAKGIEQDRIYEYGFAFEGKRVLIGGGMMIK